MKKMLAAALALLLFGCGGSDSETPIENPSTAMYFPGTDNAEWETVTPEDLNWNTNALQPLKDYLEEKHTKGFIILVNGKVAAEYYFNGHDASAPWYWASAGKTLTSTVFGIAEQEGLLDRDAKVSDYLGTGWTSETPAQENKIQNIHLLTMTSGIEDLDHGDCVTPECLEYTADAGTRWAYHNVYVKLQDVVAAAAGESYHDYFAEKLMSKIGMSGIWLAYENNIVYWSNTKSMARFGLLMLNKGKWNGTTILNEAYFNDATNTSQNINKAYGYLWWLNGKTSYHLPQTQLEFQGALIPSGSADMFMALGKNDQKIYVVPSKNMVIVRMGDAADGSNFALSDFDEILWQKINALINN